MEDSRAVLLLRYANFAKVGKALGVSRASVAEWAKGRNVTPYRLRQLEELLIPEQQETAPPEWARRLAMDTALSVIGALAPEAEQRAAAAVIARLEGTQPPNGDSPHGSIEAISQDEVEPPGRVRE